MSNSEEENKEELTPEEQQLQKNLTKAISKNAQVFVDKVFAPLNWCWPVTIVLLFVRWFLNSIGYYDLSLLAATVFLWGPLALLAGMSTLFISFVYIIALFGAWHKFLQNVVFYFKLGFGNGASKKEQKQEDEQNETYSPPIPELEDPRKDKKDDEAL